MNPLLNPLYLFELGVILMTGFLAICNWSKIKGGLSRFNQWAVKSDDQEVFALLVVCAALVIGVSWVLL